LSDTTAFASAPTATTSHLFLDTPPILSPPPTRTAFIQRLKLKHRQPYPTHNDNDDAEDNDDDDDGMERDPGLSLPSSTSHSPTTQSPITPLSPIDNDDQDFTDRRGGHGHGDQRWILSAACDEELKEWGRYLDEAEAEAKARTRIPKKDAEEEVENCRRLSAMTATSSAGWSAIALSCDECIR
jgi:hypothetical protein